MMKMFGKRILAMAVASAIVAGITMTYGIPNIKYKPVRSSAPVVMTVNGDDVHADEFRAYLKYNKMYMENMLSYYGYDDSVWSDPQVGAPFVEQLFDMADQQAAYMRAITGEFDALHLKLTREEKERAEADKQLQIEQMGGKEMFNDWLASFDYTSQIYDNTVATTAYLGAIERAYYGENGTKTTEQAILDAFHENYLCAKHILVQTVDGLGEELTGEALSAAESKANEALEKVKAGEDFDTLVQQYNEDPGMEMYPEGYVFTDGDMVKEFYDGAKALEPGQTSGELVKSSFGWHIIKREPLTKEQMTPAIQQQLIHQLTGKTFDDEVTALVESVKIEHTGEYGEANYENLMKIIAPETPDAEKPDTEESGKPDAQGDPEAEGTAETEGQPAE
ncbi:MAG: peptidylprolyl isomerase [Butyricicoccus pullicaecorum]|nr:peptidylprolyl isomerase [Butyricicoccus pullicaecorum]